MLVHQEQQKTYKYYLILSIRMEKLLVKNKTSNNYFNAKERFYFK